MANKVLLKKSSVALKVPTTSDLDYGELALNYADGKLYFKNSTNTIQSLGTTSYTKVIANVTAQLNQGYIANTTSGSFTITLPATPQTGNYVTIVDDGSFYANPLYVARNGNPIVGTAQDLTLDIQGVSVTLLFDGGQWNVYSQVGATGGTGTGSGSQALNYNSFASALIPSATNTYSLGNSSYLWSSVYATSLVGTLTGNADTATRLATPRAINGVNFDGSAAITITAAAPNALTIGTGLSGISYNGSSTVTIAIDSTVATLTGSQTLTNKLISGANNTLSAIPNSALTNSTVTVNGSSISLGGSATITAVATNALTIGTGLSGTSYNGSSAITIAIDSTVATLTGTQTLTNKTISGASNTLSNIGNSSLTNSSVTINGTSVSLGGTATVTAAAGTLTGTTLNSTVVSSSLTSIGTQTILTVAGAATVTANSATDKYLAIGTHGQVFDDGNLHIHTNSGSVWINSLDGGDINLGLQTNTGASKAVAKNLSLDAGYGSVAPIYGVRAWINCGWNGSSMTTRGSGNLSVSRSGTGVYTFTFGTAMPDGNYCIQATAQTPGANSDCAVNITNGTTPSTTSFSLTVARYGNGNEDTSILHVQVVR